MPSATLGCDLQTGASLSIGDIERRSGLYILGRSGMGKYWLIVNLMLQDIQNGHGLFFLHPHGNAIDDLLARLDERYFDNVLLFDPQDKARSFGINLLACNDIHDLNERDETYTRAKGIFDKIWKNAYYELPWLQKILQFTLCVCRKP